MPLPEVLYPEIATLRLPPGTKAAVRELTPAGIPVADSYRQALDEWIERQRRAPKAPQPRSTKP